MIEVRIENAELSSTIAAFQNGPRGNARVGGIPTLTWNIRCGRQPEGTTVGHFEHIAPPR